MQKTFIQCTGIESDNIAYVLPKEMNKMGKMGTTKRDFFKNNNRHMVTMENQSFLPLVQFLIVFLY